MNQIQNVLTEIDNDLIPFRNIQDNKDKILYVKCNDKNYMVKLRDYIYNYYQVFSYSLFDFNIFSLIRYLIEGDEDIYIKDQFNFHIFSKIKDEYIFETSDDAYTFDEDDNEDTNPFLITKIKNIINYIEESKDRYHIIPLSTQNYFQDFAHQLGMIIEKTLDDITIAVFDPNGSKNIYEGAIIFTKVLKRYLESHFKVPVYLMENGDVSQSLGIQQQIPIPFCVMFTYMWFYVFYKSSLTIKTPMREWLNLVEKTLTSHVLSKKDPEAYVLSFSYLTVENVLKYISTLPKDDIDEKTYKKLQRDIDFRDMEIINLYKEDLTIDQLIKLKFCNMLNETIAIPTFKNSCDNNDECKKGELCLNKKCVAVPIIENTFVVYDKYGEKVENEEVYNLLEKENIFDEGFDIDVDGNLTVYTDEKPDSIIKFRDYTIKLLESIMYDKKGGSRII